MSKVIFTFCLLFFTVFSFVGPTYLSAQGVNIYVEETAAELNGSVTVNVRVENFTDIAGAQFSLNWDADQLEFTSLSNLALNASEGGNFNLGDVSEGKLGYIIADMSLQGFDLDNETILFSIEFDVMLEDNSSTEITFSDVPTEIVVANSDGQALDFNFTEAGGMIIVGNPTGTIDVFEEDTRFTASPNPFQGHTTLTFTAERAGLAQLAIFDVAGHLVYQKEIDALVGKNNLLVSANDLSANGVYMLRLTTKYGNFSRKLVFSGGRL